MKKNVIVIGGDHHNTLAVVRSFYKNNINFKLLIHSEQKRVKISSSKSIKSYDIVKSDSKEIMDYLKKNIKKEKQLIFPCSDLAEYTIDKNNIELSNNYIFPCFKNKPGRVTYLMDKYNQKIWADDFGFPMAKTWIINLLDSSKDDNLHFPCILKPEISAMGEKSDIRICRNLEDYHNSLEELKEKKYSEILVQEFLNKKYEVCCFGCIIDETFNKISCIIKKEREYPPDGGGSLALASFIDNIEVKKLLESILQELYKDGYRGFYDIEFLVCEEGIYLNEINFRHSGNGYALIANGIDAPFLWYQSFSKNIIDINKIKLKSKQFYFMDETNELKLLKTKSINIFQFINDLFKTNSYARIKKDDLKVVIGYLKK